MRRLLVAALVLSGCGRTVGLMRPDSNAPLESPAGTALGSGEDEHPEEAGPPTVPLAVDWKYSMRNFDVLPFAPIESASPLIGGDLLLASTSRGQTVYALDRHTGATKWIYRAGGRVEATPAIGGGRVFLADAKGRAHGVDLATGKGIWRVDLKGVSTSHLAYDGEESGRVIIATGDNQLHALNAKDGSEAWTYRRDPPADLTIYGTSTPVRARVGGDDAWIVGFSDGSLVAIRAANGTPIWEARLVAAGRFRDVDGAVAIFADRVYVTAFDDNLFCLEASTGKILWSQPPGGAGGVVIASGKLLHGTDKGEVIARDVADGRELWRWKLPAGVPTTPVVAGDNVFVASSSRTLYALRLENGSLAWTFEPGYRVSGSWAAPVVRGERVYFTSNAGTVYAFEPAAPGVQFIGTWDSGARREK